MTSPDTPPGLTEGIDAGTIEFAKEIMTINFERATPEELDQAERWASVAVRAAYEPIARAVREQEAVHLDAFKSRLKWSLMWSGVGEFARGQLEADLDLGDVEARPGMGYEQHD